MGYDCGFDIYPRLEATEANKKAYSDFIEEIVSKYKDVHDDKGRRPDGKILIGVDEIREPMDPDSLYIWLMVGECPSFPKSPEHCEYFLRFSSKVSGGLTTQAEPYIKGVCRIAKRHFGDRVKFWHELADNYGHYGWEEVNEADKKLKELGVEMSKNPPRQNEV